MPYRSASPPRRSMSSFTLSSSSAPWTSAIMPPILSLAVLNTFCSCRRDLSMLSTVSLVASSIGLTLSRSPDTSLMNGSSIPMVVFMLSIIASNPGPSVVFCRVLTVSIAASTSCVLSGRSPTASCMDSSCFIISSIELSITACELPSGTSCFRSSSCVMISAA